MTKEETDYKKKNDPEEGVGNNVDNHVDDDFDGKMIKPLDAMSTKEKLSGTAAVTAAGVSVAMILVTGGTIVIIAGVLGIGLGGYQYYQETQLQLAEKLKDVREALRKEIDKLTQQNKRMKENLEEVTTKVNELDEIASGFELMADHGQKGNLTLVKCIEQNEKILKRLRGSLREHISQNIITIIMKVDQNRNRKIESNDLEALRKKLAEINNIHIDVNEFSKQFESHALSYDDCLKIIMEYVQKDRHLIGDIGNQNIFRGSYKSVGLRSSSIEGWNLQ